MEITISAIHEEAIEDMIENGKNELRFCMSEWMRLGFNFGRLLERLSMMKKIIQSC